MRRLPERPRLAEHVVARRHLVGDGSAVVLHDLRSGRAVKLGEREWELLASADGTRDLEGILLAAAHEGARARTEHLRSFLEQLHEAGFVDGGATEPTAVVKTGDDAERPIDVLAEFSLHCDGHGSCCRQYETVLFSPAEAARARAFCPDVLDAGSKHERAFLPERGSSLRGGAAVALVDGACAYLAGALSCRIHEAGGEAAKPLGCRVFPATFVDDGVRLRVSAAVECACVLASVGRGGGAPLVRGPARTRADLAPEIDVVAVPALVRVTAERSFPRGTLHDWSSRIALGPPPDDAVAALLTLADVVERDGLTQGAASADPANPPRHEEILRAHLRALHARVVVRARDGARWRSDGDFTRQALGWMDRACAALLTGSLAIGRSPPADRARESFYVRASIFGHALALDDVPLVTALRDRAARLVLARALGTSLAASPEPVDPGLREPIAVVEAMLRAHGLSAYVHDLNVPTRTSRRVEGRSAT